MLLLDYTKYGKKCIFLSRPLISLDRLKIYNIQIMTACLYFRTPLMLACTKQELSTIQVLLRHGASVSLTNKDGWTPFHLACREGCPEVVLFLLSTSPNYWDTASNNGRTPLHSAGKDDDPLPDCNSLLALGKGSNLSFTNYDIPYFLD